MPNDPDKQPIDTPTTPVYIVFLRLSNAALMTVPRRDGLCAIEAALVISGPPFPLLLLHNPPDPFVQANYPDTQLLPALIPPGATPVIGIPAGYEFFDAPDWLPNGTEPDGTPQTIPPPPTDPSISIEPTALAAMLTLSPGAIPPTDIDQTGYDGMGNAWVYYDSNPAPPGLHVLCQSDDFGGWTIAIDDGVNNLWNGHKSGGDNPSGTYAHEPNFIPFDLYTAATLDILTP